MIQLWHKSPKNAPASKDIQFNIYSMLRSSLTSLSKYAKQASKVHGVADQKSDEAIVKAVQIKTLL